MGASGHGVTSLTAGDAAGPLVRRRVRPHNRRMVERARRGRGKRKLLGNHQRSWLWGRHVVTETLRAARWPVSELHLSEQLDEADRESARVAAAVTGADVFVEPPERLRELCKSSEHQGFVARMGDFPYAGFDAAAAARQGRPLITLLDGIQDPYNFGAILRSADALGVTGVVVGQTSQVGVTTHVARSSAGAVNHVPIARVESLAAGIAALRDRGVTVVGASEKADRSLVDVDLTRPVAIAVGNEGRGLSPDVRDACSDLVRIPQQGRVSSLNAAAAAAILFYEAARQRSAANEVND